MRNWLGRPEWIILILTAAARGQTAAEAPRFEVASIKLSPPPTGVFVRTMARGGPGTPDPGLFRCENCSLTMLLTRAFDLKEYQLSGPNWMESTRVNISAKVDPGTTKEQFRRMQQNLLADRFKMRIHRDKKEMPVYELVVAKDGPKLKASVPVGESPEPPVAAPGHGIPPPKMDPDGFPVLLPGRGPLVMTLANGRTTMRCGAESMAEFAASLSDQLHRPVVDATGLNGRYDIVLNWIVEGPGYAADDHGGLTIFGAVQKQLGLRLQKGKAPVEILVVDHIEKAPTEN